MSERTSLKYVYYALQLYSSGLSLRKTSQHLSLIIKRNHVSVWNWIQKYEPKKILQKRDKIQEFIIDETLIKVSNDYVWVWVAIEPTDKVILDIRISFERTMLVAERFLKDFVKRYSKRPVSTDGGTWYPSQACNFLELKHYLHSP
jgi:putative transposase